MRPLAAALATRVARFANGFRQIIFAQVRISALNTVFTALFLLAILPIFGVHLPLTKTLIAITFLAGLLPVVGNLISNSVIFVIALSISFYTALAALLFLIVIHKLEYFLNARIIGARIHASAWELLLAMILLEVAFGITGLIAAPIYYAYIKNELTDAGLI
jgi:predicted PurR-regulated permease PerM